MQVKKTINSETSLSLHFTVDEKDLTPIKKQAAVSLGKDLKIPGFRAGKIPQELIEKNVDQSLLQTEVIEEAVNSCYVQAIDSEKFRPVRRPEVSIIKFVPFTTLEFEMKVDVIGEMKLADYKKVKKPREKAAVTAKDVAEVIDSLKTRLSDRKEVKRAAKSGDQVTLDFKGVDADGQPVNGAEGKEYPLVLGSNAFIPGFEDEVVGLKAGEEKTFDITFPKDYGVKALASKKVTFTINVHKVEEMVEPKVDDAFAQKAGPFKTLDELKEDIKTQLSQERQQSLDREYEQALVDEIAAKSKVAIPEALIEEQLEVAEREEKQNLVYRGQTWEEHLKEEGVTEAQHREQNRPKAEARIKAGLVLSEISEKEGLTVTPEELEIRIQLLKGQYQDAAMQAELDKPENRRDIAMRMLTEKTVEKLTEYATAK